MPWVNRPPQHGGLKGRENLGGLSRLRPQESLATFQAASHGSLFIPGHRPTGRSPGLGSAGPLGRVPRRSVWPGPEERIIPPES